MIHEYLEYPTKEQWIDIEEHSKINHLYLDIKRPEITDFFALFTEHELASWVRLFNNRLGQSRTSYIFLCTTTIKEFLIKNGISHREGGTINSVFPSLYER